MSKELSELDCIRFDRVSKPVDITDADRFPEIARALEHAAKLKESKR